MLGSPSEVHAGILVFPLFLYVITFMVAVWEEREVGKVFLIIKRRLNW
jgi:hypothetical protein